MQAIITISKLIQDSQNFGGDSVHMVSRAFFDLEIDGKLYPDLFANIKQTIGAPLSEPLEVSRPDGYAGPFNFEAFQSILDRYYRSFGLDKAAGAPLIGRRNTFSKVLRETFAVDPAGAGW